MSGELCSDASYGFPNRLSLYPDPLTSIYTVDTIHSPATTDRITYSLQYSIDSSGGDVSTSIPIGVLESSANSIILEELNGTGTTGPSIWTKGPSNTIYYIGGQVGINRQIAEAILDIQQAENADVSGNTNVISRGDAIKIRNLANTSNWIIACNSSVSGSDLFILNENEQGGKIDGNEAPSNRFQDITFTGQHRTIYKNMNIENDIGLIVVSNNQYLNLDNTIEPTVDESLPIVVLASTDNDKQVFGVVSNIENQNYKSRIHNTGRFASYIQKYTVNERRVLINSVGEGGIWVCNKNGILENGDYITSSSVIGYGVKQQDDILHNYTVAKITCSCDFNLNKIIKRKVNTIIDGDNNRQIVYTTDGDIEYVDDLDSLGNIQMVYKYDTRFLDVSGNIVNEGQHSYIACFVGCTYHCG